MQITRASSGYLNENIQALELLHVDTTCMYSTFVLHYLDGREISSCKTARCGSCRWQRTSPPRPRGIDTLLEFASPDNAPELRS